MKNKIGKEIRRKMINIIREVGNGDIILLESEKDRLLNSNDDDFFEFIFNNLALQNRKDMDEVMLLYMKLNMYLSEIFYEIYIKEKNILENEYKYGYRKKDDELNDNDIKFLCNVRYPVSPSLCLWGNNWDDYGYKTTFELYYHDKVYNEIYIGSVKILNSNEHKTNNIIPKMFYELPKGFYSLGQSINFYTKLSFFVPNYQKVLRALNDIAIDENNRKEIEIIDNTGFQNSLLRFSEARKVLDEVFEKEITKNTFSFNYEFSHMNYGKNERSNTINIEFNFDKDDILPYRINAIIGKNGVGKTQIIKNLSEEISGMMFSNENGNEENGFVSLTDEDDEFYTLFEKVKEYPNFSKIITVSYSAFDNFRKIDGIEKSKFNYVYCGLYKHENGKDERLSIKEIKENIIEAKKEIAKRGRKEDWINSIKLISESTDIVEMLEKAEKEEDIELSSGELVSLSCITDIMKYISNQSLILLDEPELHLHPNAISNFMKMFNKILEKYDSYAIMSTHSPIIIQEITSRNVNIILRNNDLTIVRRLGIECFGESIDNINKDVFYFDKSSLNYKNKLEHAIKNNSYEKIVKQFDNELSLNAKIYLKVLENQKEQ